MIEEYKEYFVFPNTEQETYKGEEIKLPKDTVFSLKKVYKKFTQIAEKFGNSIEKAELFYLQAKEIENLEDHYEHPLVTHYYYWGDSTYCNFTWNEFRCYLTWRTRVRKSIFEKTDTKYVRIYINELVNGIGCQNEWQSVEKLITFWCGYRKIDSHMDVYMSNVIEEFYCISNMNEPFQKIQEKFPVRTNQYDKNVKEVLEHNYKNKFEFLNTISSYKVMNSRFLETTYGSLLIPCVEKSMERLDEYLFEQKGISLPELIVQKNESEYWWLPLLDYTILSQNMPKNKRVCIDDMEKYYCENGKWTRCRYTTRLDYRNFIGYILKYVEYVVREYIGYRKLKQPTEQDILDDLGYSYYNPNAREKIHQLAKSKVSEVIIETVTEYLQQEKVPQDILKRPKNTKTKQEVEEKVAIEFHTEDFDTIRAKAENIQKTLIIEEIEEKEEITVAQSIISDKQLVTQSSENEFETFISELTDIERNMVEILIKGNNVKESIVQISHMSKEMPEVIASSINDKALNTLGDTIIDNTIEGIYPEYQEELLQVIGKGKTQWQ